MTIRVVRLTGIVGMVAGVALALCAGAAPARDMGLWGCHGPLGQPLGGGGLAAVTSGDGVRSSLSAACGGGGSGAALVASFSRADPVGGSVAAWRADVPDHVTLTGARVVRGITPAAAPYASGGALQRYVAHSSAGVLESINLIDVWAMPPVTSSLAADGAWVSAGVDCARPADERCGAGTAGAASIAAIALDVDDAVAPTGAVGGVVSPVRGTLTLSVNAADVGVGLARAQVLVDGAIAAEVALDDRCAADLDGGATATPDVPLGGCLAAVTGVPLRVDLSGRSVGDHQFEVRVVDGAGNAADVWDGVVAVAAPEKPLDATVEVKVGDPGTGGSGGGGGVGGTGGTTTPGTATVPACLKPRLSMMLDQKPLRMTKARPLRPVLRAGARYRFRGSLTCVVGSKRKVAPPGVPVEILNKVGKRVSAVTGATTASGGKLTVILSYKSSRTLIFRHKSANGTSEVRIAVVVVKKASRTKTSR